ncbi:MAG TPA: alpha-galactosidase [Candidatus Paceibacterota bacterium]|jgi:alpha-galactosidase|nr:alpha-galactosidase [Candidatus Paceibacterota bacterium]
MKGRIFSPSHWGGNMISFDEKLKIFKIANEKVQYVFFINELNQLQHLYYGKPSKKIDIAEICDFGYDWPRHYYDHKTGEEIVMKYTYVNRSLFEVPTSGYNDKRVKMVDVLHNKSDFRYVSYELLKGKFCPKGLPHFKDENNEGETLHIILKDTNKDIYLHLYYSLLKDYPIIFKNQILDNKDESIYLRKAHTFNLDILRSGFDLIHFPGQWCQERMVCREPINRGIKKIASNTGRSSHEENPFIYVLEKDADEYKGEVYSFSLVYSGNFAFEIEVDKYGSTRVSGGINEEDFLFEIKTGDSFVFPEAILGYNEHGLGELTRRTHDLIREHLIPHRNHDLKETILLNSWEGCYLTFDTELILSYIEKAAEIGVRLFVLDDGWFLNRNDDSTSLGDWVIDTKKIDLQKIIDKCHECGMKFGLWFEPEMINPKSNLFRKHPEFAAVELKNNPYLSRHQLCLDLCNKDAINNVLSQMYKILDNYEIDYVKWDHNRTIDAAYSSVLDKNHQGEFYHRNILGFYHICEALKNRYPHILFHGCASGGGRFDLGTLYYYPDYWTSDNNDPIDRLFIQYGTSMLYPLLTMGAHVSDKTSASYTTKGQIALFGTYGFELDPNKLTKSEKEELLSMNEIFDKYHKNVISDGDLYRIKSPFTGKAFQVNCVSKDKSEALLLYVGLEEVDILSLKVDGLMNDKKYRNSYDNLVYSGKYYKEKGILVPKSIKKHEGLLVILKEEK